MQVMEDEELVIILMFVLIEIVNYAKGAKSDRERQIPWNFTYTWNLKIKISEQTK